MRFYERLHSECTKSELVGQLVGQLVGTSTERAELSESDIRRLKELLSRIYLAEQEKIHPGGFEPPTFGSVDAFSPMLFVQFHSVKTVLYQLCFTIAKHDIRVRKR